VVEISTVDEVAQEIAKLLTLRIEMPPIFVAAFGELRPRSSLTSLVDGVDGTQAHR